MRALMLLTAILVASCASGPSKPPQIASSSGKIAASDAQSLELARNLNLKVIDKDGQRLYCRSDYVTGSHIQRDTTCFNAEQLEKMYRQQQRDLDQLALKSSAGGIRVP